MVNFSSEKHDIGLLRSDGSTQVGLMLATERDKDGNEVPIYRNVYDSYLVNQYTTSPDYGATNPQEELHIVGESWRGGLGQYIHDSAQPERYYSSIGCDLSDKDQAMAGWNSAAITLPTTTSPVLVDGGMELWNTATDMTSWTGSAAAVEDREDTEIHSNGGTYSLRLDGDNTFMYQTISFDAGFKGRRFTFTCWVHADNASTGKIGINPGGGVVWSGYHTGGGAWEQLSVSGTVPSDGTSISVHCYCDTANNCYFDDAALAGTTPGAIASHATFNSKEYIGQGAVLAKMNAGGTEFESQYEFSAAITALIPFQVSGTDYLIIFLGTSTSYEYMTTAQAFTTSNATYKTFQFGAWVNTTADTLYANDANNKIRSTVNPLNAGTEWSNPQTIVGEASNAITGMLEKSGALYMMKTDMPYYLDSSGNVQKDLAPELKSAKSSTSGKNAHIWKNAIYVPAGDQALLEIGTANTFRNPSDYCTNLSDFVGRVFAVASDEKWLFVAVDNGTKVEILKGRQETIDGTTSWVWHPFHELTLTGCETMWVSTVVAKRLYISSTTASENLYYLPLPTKYGDITNDSAVTFKTDGYFITPYYHGNFKSSPKAFVNMTADLGHTFSASTYYECHYQGLGAGTTWVDMGDLKGSSTSMTETLYNTAPPVSTMFRFKFVGKTASTAVTPILHNFDAKMILQPTARIIHEYLVRCADGIRDKEGVILQGVNASYIRAVLEEARDATGILTFYDIHGNTKYGVVQPVETFAEPAKSQDGENIEEIYHLKIQEVSLS